MKDYEPQLEGLLNFFNQAFIETNSVKLELVKTLFLQYCHSDVLETGDEKSIKIKNEKIEEAGKKYLEQLKTGIQDKNWMEVAQYTNMLNVELEGALNDLEKRQWETFISLVIKQIEQNKRSEVIKQIEEIKQNEQLQS